MLRPVNEKGKELINRPLSFMISFEIIHVSLVTPLSLVPLWVLTLYNQAFTFPLGSSAAAFG